MDMTSERVERIIAIDHIIRRITWQGQKQALQTLARPEIMMTMPQMVTLFAIRSANKCRMSELAEVTQQSAGTLTGIVDRLIEEGLVQRVRDAEDRRVVQVALTPVGQEKMRRVEQLRYDDMTRMLKHFSMEQIQQLENLLNQFLDGIEEWHEEMASRHVRYPSNHLISNRERPEIVHSHHENGEHALTREVSGNLS